MYNQKNQKNQHNKHKINDEIKHHKVMLVGPNVDKGVYSIKKANEIAKKNELDLVLISDKSNPPVCKLMDYNKFIFDQNKKNNKTKPKTLKTVRFRPNTGVHDLEVKMKQIKKFLKKGNKVKVFVFFKGRENKFKEEGEKLLLQLAQDITEDGFGIPENLPKKEGHNKISMILKPPKSK